MTFFIPKQQLLGIFFILPLLAYGIGTALLTPFLLSPIPSSWLVVYGGAALIILNSILVIAIGYLVSHWLHSSSVIIAKLYLFARVIEALLLLLGLGAWLYAIVYLAPADRDYLLKVQVYCYQIAMLILGVGSLAFCWGLFQSSLSLKWSLWATIGYLLLGVGSLLELLGWAHGIVLSIPGGLFELCFGLLLLISNFRPSTNLSQAFPNF